MIKCLHVISDTNIGGAGKILLSFLKNYDRRRFDVAVVLPQNSALIPQIHGLDVRVIEVNALADRSYRARDISLLYDLFCFEKPDIVHTHASFSARIAAKKYGCKIVSTRHSVFEQPVYKKRFPVKQLLGYLNNHYGDAVIAVSPAAKDNITEIGADPARIEVIFNGVDPVIKLDDPAKRQIRRRYQLKEEDFVCAIIARLEPVKGHTYVLDAAKILQDRGCQVKFLIAGTGSAEALLRQKAQILGLEHVIFTGFVDRIWEIENIMNLQLNASYGTEATSLALLEGMSLGIPAVVSDFGGNPYVIEDGVNGLVIPKQNAALLAETIEKLVSQPQLYQRLAEGCRQVYASSFTAQAMTGQMETLYEKLIKKEGHAHE